jgi:multiple sugar transport system substrate-binding protein
MLGESRTFAHGAAVPSRKNGLSRRDFLRLGGTGLAGATLLGFAGCGRGSGQGGDSGTVTYAEGPDDTGTLQKLLDGFNKKYQGRYKVRYREMPADTQSYFDQLRTEFQAGDSEIDVIAGDVIWPAQLASNGWLLDLSDRFTEELQSKFIEGNVESNVYKGKIYGVPFVTGAGLLYYRKDLLERSGFSGPPETWDELKQMAKKVKEDAGTKFGFVFQGANYEGGVCNALEYIWSYGGDILDGEKVVIDSPDAVAGLAEYRSMISDGITTQAVSTYKEEEAQAAFLRGDAVFMRNWSYVYALTSDPTQSKIKPEQVGLSTLPVAEKGEKRTGVLGATNLYVNATTKSSDASWALIRYFTAPEQQKMRAIEGTRLPVLKSSYEDEQLLDKVPTMALGKKALRSARPRPVSPYYSDMSLKMAEQFNAVLKGEASPDQATKTLQTELTSIVEQGG